MIIIKSPREIKLMREAGVVVGEVFAALETFIKPGVSTLEISELVEKVMVEHGAKSAEKGYCGYPAAACVSVNEELVHGIPSAKRILRDGDIVSVDIVALRPAPRKPSYFSFSLNNLLDLNDLKKQMGSLL